jgi:hypothetical protein
MGDVSMDRSGNGGSGMSRRFEANDAQDARNGNMLPLLIGLTGPSGSGKTFSALRLASGIQSVVGGDIFVIDTEQRRSLHYADKFAFKHVNFGEPFGSLDYLEALRFAKKAGAGVVVIDSCSHEHDGPGGLLEQWDAEMKRLAGDDYGTWKAEKYNMQAWQKPKAGRRKLIAALTSELDLPCIFCFRARETTKPEKVTDDRGRNKTVMVDQGFKSIAADEWIFEMALSALLLPGSCGVPTWRSDKPGERLVIKLPEQFKSLAEPPPFPLDEKVGRRLALWAKGEKPAAKPAAPAERFQATTPAAVEEAAGVEPEGEAEEAAASASGGLFSEPEHIALGSEIEAKLKLATSGDALASSWVALTDDLKRLKAMDEPTYDAIVRLKNRMKTELVGGAE